MLRADSILTCRPALCPVPGDRLLWVSHQVPDLSGCLLQWARAQGGDRHREGVGRAGVGDYFFNPHPRPWLFKSGAPENIADLA